MSAPVSVNSRPVVAPAGDTNASAPRGSNADTGSVFADMVGAKASEKAVAPAPTADVPAENAGVRREDLVPPRSLLSSPVVAALRARSVAETTETASEIAPSAPVVTTSPIEASPADDGGSVSTASTDEGVATDLITAATTDSLGLPVPTPVVAAPPALTASIDAKASGPKPVALTADDNALELPSADGALSMTGSGSSEQASSAKADGDAVAAKTNATRAAQAFAALLPAAETSVMKDAPANASTAASTAQTPSTEAPTQNAADVASSASPAAAMASSDLAEAVAATPAPATRPLTLPIEPVVNNATPQSVLSAPPTTAAPAPPPVVVPSTLSHLSQATLETTVQIAAQITRKLEGRSTRFEMGLTPEGLGRVDVSLDIDAGGRLTARLAFDNPLAATELRGKADELRRELTDAGFTIARDGLDFSERQSSSSGGGFDRQQGRAFASASRIAADADLSQPAPAAWMSLSLTRSGVDMKV